MKNKINNLFMFNITVFILIAISIQTFADKKTFLETFGSVISKYYGIVIVSFIFAYIFFKLIEDNLSNKELAKPFRFLILNLIFSASIIYGVMYPNLLYGFFVFVIPAATTANILISVYLCIVFIKKLIIKIL